MRQLVQKVVVDEAENNRLFDHDKEIIIYKDKNDCLDKLKYFLKNEKEAQDIANNGFNKTLLNHTAKVRADQLNQIFEKLFKFKLFKLFIKYVVIYIRPEFVEFSISFIFIIF